MQEDTHKERRTSVCAGGARLSLPHSHAATTAAAAAAATTTRRSKRGEVVWKTAVLPSLSPVVAVVFFVAVASTGVSFGLASLFSFCFSSRVPAPSAAGSSSSGVWVLLGFVLFDAPSAPDGKSGCSSLPADNFFVAPLSSFFFFCSSSSSSSFTSSSLSSSSSSSASSSFLSTTFSSFFVFSSSCCLSSSSSFSCPVSSFFFSVPAVGDVSAPGNFVAAPAPGNSVTDSPAACDSTGLPLRPPSPAPPALLLTL
ncbi:hypothetical protein ECC02_010189 [Trypanosoma cruzi]|uniref:Uncharacterized protein n=1 Tax=Trypanosoma cruzi TaxID=5693 RepID=A0A7J6XS72_TRYCR|nr:hypothetical protein ECC02_010189 [Trypanosoma cruzi]